MHFEGNMAKLGIIMKVLAVVFAAARLIVSTQGGLSFADAPKQEVMACFCEGVKLMQGLFFPRARPSPRFQTRWSGFGCYFGGTGKLLP